MGRALCKFDKADSPFSNVKGNIVENQNILLFPRQVSLFWNGLITSCIRKVKGEFIATTICEVLDSFNKIVNFAQPDLHP